MRDQNAEPDNGHTGARQPVLQPAVPAAAVAPLVENITEKYATLKLTVHDFLVTLPPGDPCWDSSFLPTLAEQVGLTKP